MLECHYCGQMHARQRCPAYGKTCTNCKKPNHFAKVCRSKNVNEVQANSDEEDEEFGFIIDAVTSSTIANTWHVNTDIAGNTVQFKVDTGAQANIITKQLARIIKKTFPYHIRQTRGCLSGYGGNKLPVTGKCVLPCTHKGKTYMCEFYIVDVASGPILGLKDCVNMDLVRLIRSVEKTSSNLNGIENYQDVFKGLGCLEELYHIQTKPDVNPVVHAPRKTPVALTYKVKEDLRRMEKLQVITKVDGPTE